MSSLTDHIHQLLLAEAAGTISPEDKVYLDEIVVRDAAVYSLRRYMLERAQNSALQQVLSPGRHETKKQHLLSSQQKAERSPRWAHLSIAASLLLVVVALYTWLRTDNSSKHTTNLASTDLTSPDHVKLLLGNGEVVDLSSPGKLRAQAGKIIINNQQQSASFAATGSSREQWGTLTVPAGRDYSIHLADGTEIQLNAASTLKFPLAFTGIFREVILDGEAYFKIAQDVEKPFRVKLLANASNTGNNLSVQVLGTEFNINSYNTMAIKIALVQGAIKVKRGGDSLLVKPGFEVTARGNTPLQSQHFDQDDVLSWREGIFRFYDTPLSEVCPVIQRWYGTKIILDNDQVGTRRFKGYISRKEPINVFLENLKAISNVNSYIDQQQRVHLK